MRRKLLFALPLLALFNPLPVQAATTKTTKLPWVGPSGKIEGYIIQTIYPK